MTLPWPKSVAFPTGIERLSETNLLDAYRTMVCIRRFEEKAAQLYAIGEIAVLPPLSIGHEAILTAAALSAGAGEQIVSFNPSAGLKLAHGTDARELMEQLLDGSFAMTPAGRSEATIILADPSVAAADVSEAMIKAKTVSTPVVFVVINATTDVSETLNLSADRSIFARDVAQFGISAELTDGTDVERTRNAIRNAIALSRTTGGPSAIEAMIYRYRGHTRTGQTKPSHPREVIDPLAKTRAQLLALGDTMTASVAAVEQGVRDSINAAAAHARGLQPMTSVKP